MEKHELIENLKEMSKKTLELFRNAKVKEEIADISFKNNYIKLAGVKDYFPKRKFKIQRESEYYWSEEDGLEHPVDEDKTCIEDYQWSSVLRVLEGVYEMMWIYKVERALEKMTGRAALIESGNMDVNVLYLEKYVNNNAKLTKIINDKTNNNYFDWLIKQQLDYFAIHFSTDINVSLLEGIDFATASVTSNQRLMFKKRFVADEETLIVDFSALKKCFRSKDPDFDDKFNLMMKLAEWACYRSLITETDKAEVDVFLLLTNVTDEMKGDTAALDSDCCDILFYVSTTHQEADENETYEPVMTTVMDFVRFGKLSSIFHEVIVAKSVEDLNIKDINLNVK